jgi:hypothetical protein
MGRQSMGRDDSPDLLSGKLELHLIVAIRKVLDARAEA